MRLRRPDLRKVGLALGGGAVLGAAHIGVLRALEEREIELHCLSGTSIGALVGALYAFDVAPDKIAEIAKAMRFMDISSLSLSRFGILSNEPVAAVLKKHIGKDANLEDARLPLAIVATDIGNGKRVVFREGSLSRAVMASTCVPGVFAPVEWDGRLLVDGGLVENVPVSPLRAMGAVTRVGVDLNANRRYSRPEDIFDVVANGIDIAIDHSARLQGSEAEVVIAPDLNGHSRTDPAEVDKLVEAGYRTALETIDKQFFVTVF